MPLGLLSPTSCNVPRQQQPTSAAKPSPAAAAAQPPPAAKQPLPPPPRSSAELIPLGAAGTLRLEQDSPLGKGGFGVVHRGTLNGAAVAIKVVPHDPDDEETSREDLRREVRAHQQLFAAAAPPRAHLAQLMLHLEQPRSSRTLLVLELVEGIELFDLVVDETPDGRLAEAEARAIARHLADALVHCHAQGVAHLDIKPNNVLVARRPDGAPPAVRLIDYGCADLYDPAEPDEAWVDECGGTDNYMVRARARGVSALQLCTPRTIGPRSTHAHTCSHVRVRIGESPHALPQCVACSPALHSLLPSLVLAHRVCARTCAQAPERHFDDDERGFLAPHADVYGLGCVFFFMLCGRPPFDWAGAQTDEASAQVVRAVRVGALPFDQGARGGAAAGSPPSPAAQELIRWMTRPEPTERPCAATVAAHDWLVHASESPGDAGAALKRQRSLDGAFSRLSL